MGDHPWVGIPCIPTHPSMVLPSMGQKILGRVIIINGNGEYGLLAAYVGRPVTQASWLCPKVDAHLAQCCIHHLN